MPVRRASTTGSAAVEINGLAFEHDILAFGVRHPAASQRHGGAKHRQFLQGIRSDAGGLGFAQFGQKVREIADLAAGMP